MHSVVPDICNTNGCLISVTLQWLKYSTSHNSATHYTKKGHTHSKNDRNPFLSFIIHNDWLQNYYWFAVKSVTPHFVVVVSNLLPIYFHIGSGMPYMCIFVEELGMTDTCLWLELEHKQ